jgi:hypothetical protein
MQTNIKKIIKITSLSVLFLFIIIYAFFNSRDLIFGVKIKNVNITDGQKITDNTINITGNAEHAIELTINGREISMDQQGNFNETIALFSGYNVIDIRAIDKFKKSDEKIYKLMH